MVYKNESYVGDDKTHIYPFPPQNITAEEKNEVWHRKMCEAIYTLYINDAAVLGIADIEWINRNTQYSTGRQSIDQYMDALVGKAVQQVDGNWAREGFSNINFNDLLAPMPNMLKDAYGRLSSQRTEISVDAVDERSDFGRTKRKNELRIRKDFKSIIDQVNQFGIDIKKEDEMLPDSMEELELMDKMGFFKMGWELAYEKKLIPHTLRESDDKRQSMLLLYDLLKNHVGATMDFWNHEKRIYDYERVDIADVIIEKCDGRDYRKATYCGLCRLYSVADIRAELKRTGAYNEEVEAMLAATANQYSGKMQNPSSNKWVEYKSWDNQAGRFRYDIYQVPVLCGYLRTWDKKFNGVKTEKEVNGEGVKKSELQRGKIIKDGGKYYKSDMDEVEVVRQCKWIIGTKISFDYGIMPNSYHGCRLPIHVFEIEGLSPVESAIPHADQIAVTWYKYQDESAKFPAIMIEIEKSALEGIEMNKEKLSSRQALKMAMQSSLMIYRDKSLYGNQYYKKPVTIETTGILDALKGRLEQVSMNKAMMLQAIGIDQLPDRNATATEIQAAGFVVNNILKPIWDAYLWIKCDTIRTIVNKTQMLLCNTGREETGYAHVIDDADYRAIQEAGKYPMTTYGIDIIELPSPDKMQAAMKPIEKALNDGILKPSQYSFIMQQILNGHGLKYSTQYLAIQETKSEKKMQDQKMQAIQAQSQGLNSNVQTKHQGKMEEIEMQEKMKTIRELLSKGKEGEDELNKALLQMGHEMAMGQQQQQGQPGQQPGGQPPM